MKGLKILLWILFLKTALESCLKTSFSVLGEKNKYPNNFITLFFSASVHMTARINFSTIFNTLGVSLMHGRKGENVASENSHFSLSKWSFVHCLVFPVFLTCAQWSRLFYSSNNNTQIYRCGMCFCFFCFLM